MDDYRKTPDEYQTEAIRKFDDAHSFAIGAVGILDRFSTPIRIILSIILYVAFGFLFKDYRMGYGSELEDWTVVLLPVLTLVGFNVFYPKYVKHLENKISNAREKVYQDAANYRNQYLEMERQAAQKRASEIEKLYSTIREMDCFKTNILHFIKALNSQTEGNYMVSIIETMEHHRLSIHKKCQRINKKAQALGMQERAYIE